MAYTAVTPGRFTGKCWRPLTSLRFSAEMELVPVAGMEFAHVVATMPLAFARHNGAFVAVAMLATKPRANVFVAPDGRWLGPYIPAYLRSYPFRLLPHPTYPEQRVLCVLEEETVSGDAGSGALPFYDAAGELAPGVQAILQYLQKFEASRTVTDAATAALAAHGVIVPWAIGGEAGTERVDGVWRADEDVLDALDDAGYLDLKQKSALSVAYAQMLSMPRIGLFDSLVKLNDELQKNVPTPGPAANTAFQLGNHDTLRF